MTDKTVVREAEVDIVERVVVTGDLSKLTPAERVAYYRETCKSLGLNPLTRPFDYISLNGKLTLYARKDCTDQLRRIHHIKRSITSREVVNGVYVVTARAIAPNGDEDESIGAVSIEGVKGDVLANAMMKAETKSKRRVILSIVGLGWLDETELETVPEARLVNVSDEGEVQAKPQAWVTDAKILGRFWDWANNYLTLSEAQVLEALGVQALADYTGSMKDAKARIEAWVAAQANQGEPGQDGEVEI